MTDPSIDLLGPKRVELGLASTAPALQSTKALLLKGGGLAGLLVAATAIAVVMVMRQEQALQARVAELTPIAQRVDQLNQQLSSSRRRSQALSTDLESIINRLVSVRSGSAFMEQLKRVTPASVQLESVSVSASQIQIDGVVSPQPARVGPLEQLNALVLNLESLAGIPEEGVRLRQANRSDDATVDFDMAVDVDASYRPSAEALSELGAEGLARRHRWLRSQGLPL